MRQLISLLRRFRQISEQYSFESNKDLHRKELISLLSQVNLQLIGLEVPKTIPDVPVEVCSSTIYSEIARMECGIFGFLKAGDKLPLHDHPNMEGFIKPLHGKLLITSFSWLNAEEEKFMFTQEGKQMTSQRPAKFEGKILKKPYCS